MSRPAARLFAAAVALPLLVAAPEARAQTVEEPAERPERVSALEGVFTEEQAGRGKTLFEETCTACHAAGYFTASAFQRGWQGRAVYWLFKEIRTTMPEDNPGSLERREVAAVMAYILSLQGYPAGDEPLPGEDDPLRLIVMEELPEGGR